MTRFLYLGAFAAFAAIAQPAAAQVARENIEWLDVWLPDTNEHALPRVLLIGDSITRGYGKQVEAGLKGRAYVGRLATSKSLGDPTLLDQIALILREQNFDVIHFNNGMHGEGYSEEAYAAALPDLLVTLRRGAPRARLVFATTTDVRERNNLEKTLPKTDRMIRRNEIVAAFAKRENIPVDNLFAVVRDHPEFHAADGVHFNDKGYDALAAQVVKELLKVLPAEK